MPKVKKNYKVNNPDVFIFSFRLIKNGWTNGSRNSKTIELKGDHFGDVNDGKERCFEKRSI